MAADPEPVRKATRDETFKGLAHDFNLEGYRGERAGGIQLYDSILTLGLVIAQAMLRRDARWGFTSVPPPPPSPVLGGDERRTDRRPVRRSNPRARDGDRSAPAG